MLDIEPYFHIDLKGEVAIITLAGLWDVNIALQYQKEVDKTLKTLTIQRVFTVTNLRLWSLPDIDTASIINDINKKVQQFLIFQHKAIITPLKNKKLFLDIDQQFHTLDTTVETQAFLRFEEAIQWGKSLGYDVSQVPPDYIKELEHKFH